MFRIETRGLLSSEQEIPPIPRPPETLGIELAECYRMLSIASWSHPSYSFISEIDASQGPPTNHLLDLPLSGAPVWGQKETLVGGVASLELTFDSLFLPPWGQ